MFISEWTIFLGKEKENFHLEFLGEKIFYLIFEIENGFLKEEVKKTVENIRNRVQKEQPDNLFAFQKIINEEIERKFKNQSFSLACGLLVDDVFYLLTKGGGEIYLKRDGKLEKIISQNNSASGYLKEGDFFIFASNYFSRLITKDQVNEILKDNPRETVGELTPKLKEKDDSGAIALFLRFSKKEVKETFLEEEPGKPQEKTSLAQKLLKPIKTKILSLSHSFQRFFHHFHQSTPKGKKITLIIALFLFLLLLWSVGFGYQRREYARLMAKVKNYQERITNKLNEAVDLSTINIDRSLTLLEEAKRDFGELKNSVGKKEIKEIKEIEKLISEKEKEIIKKEEKNYQEFYDLNLMTKEAQGTKMYLEKDEVVILNSDRGEIYTLSLTKKSHQIIKTEEIKKASLVSSYNDTVFFFNKEKGIYKIGDDGRPTLVIKKDGDWGEIIDFWIYNGNLYLLDKDKDEVYKYLVTETGYSGKTSYFKTGQAIDLSTAQSMAIDSSIYLLTKNEVYKYTAGVRDEFKIKLPEKEGFSLTKIYTDKNCQKLYLWEKNKGKIYLLSKSGQYEQQINSKVFSQASDFVVLENQGIFVLVKDKIYQVRLD